MKNYKAVIGLGFGDEGKGLVTDYLCSQAEKPLVIRFSGGQQAGHTVVRNNIRHVFSSFGSGTLQRTPSYFARFCTIEPVAIVNELSVLLEKGVQPLLFIDAQCPVTTPYDIAHNQQTHQHGSCGVGVGDTINREENFYSLTFEDLFYPWVLKTKLDLLQQHFYVDKKNLALEEFLECCDIITHSDYVQKSYGFPENDYRDYIFEGSQGLLLDQNYGFFPHVTRSNTGTQNIVSLLGHEMLELYLVTRAYQTRHGKGPMSNEHLPHNIKENQKETNILNHYQGEFRRTLLDVSLLEYAINKDEVLRESRNKNLVITCLDQIQDEYRFTYQGRLIYCRDEAEFVQKISNILQIQNVFLSHADNSESEFSKFTNFTE